MQHASSQHFGAGAFFNDPALKAKCVATLAAVTPANLVQNTFTEGDLGCMFAHLLGVTSMAELNTSVKQTLGFTPSLAEWMIGIYDASPTPASTALALFNAIPVGADTMQFNHMHDYALAELLDTLANLPMATQPALAAA
ncbi:MAG: hypothetical protein WAX89_00080 [Alphaproteobacteria bacterium]